MYYKQAHIHRRTLCGCLWKPLPKWYGGWESNLGLWGTKQAHYHCATGAPPTSTWAYLTSSYVICASLTSTALLVCVRPYHNNVINSTCVLPSLSMLLFLPDVSANITSYHKLTFSHCGAVDVPGKSTLSIHHVIHFAGIYLISNTCPNPKQFVIGSFLADCFTWHRFLQWVRSAGFILLGSNHDKDDVTPHNPHEDDITSLHTYTATVASTTMHTEALMHAHWHNT